MNQAPQIKELEDLSKADFPTLAANVKARLGEAPEDEAARHARAVASPATPGTGEPEKS